MLAMVAMELGVASMMICLARSSLASIIWERHWKFTGSAPRITALFCCKPNGSNGSPVHPCRHTPAIAHKQRTWRGGSKHQSIIFWETLQDLSQGNPQVSLNPIVDQSHVAVNENLSRSSCLQHKSGWQLHHFSQHSQNSQPHCRHFCPPHQTWRTPHFSHLSSSGWSSCRRKRSERSRTTRQTHG